VGGREVISDIGGELERRPTVKMGKATVFYENEGVGGRSCILQHRLQQLLDPKQCPSLLHFEDAGRDAAIAGVSLNNNK
jgi:hypothetical protein